MTTASSEARRGGWRRGLFVAAMAAMFVLAMAAGGFGYFEFMPAETTCVSCHEMRPSHGRWSNAVHRGVSCKVCHGGSVSSGLHGMSEKLRRVFAHVTEARHDNLGLSEDQRISVMTACRDCHEREFAYWRKGGHGIAYAGVFLDEKHNRAEQPADDCLRCHGMFFEGRTADLVTPLDTKGPWRLKDPALASRPAIPCLACHKMHATGSPFERPAEPAPGGVPVTNGPTPRRETIGFYVRQERAHFPIDDLAVPRVTERGRPVKVSDDPRQRLCTQCHAPNAFGEAGSSDDRTPVGVHEGLSCAACHAPHSNDARNSCANCHPRLSNCGLDVRTMDTTFLTPSSRHNIHTVHCLDCHPSGAPAKPKP